MAQLIALSNLTPLKKIILRQGSELLTDLAGLALVGMAQNRFAQVRQTLDRLLPKRSGLSVGERVIAYVGLLCTGKPDYDAIENHRQDAFFVRAVGLSGVPAASTLRRQMDAQTEDLVPHVDELSVPPSPRWPVVGCRWTSMC
jgi:hypothetical protein